MQLSPKQRAKLRKIAHHLKPIHFVGKEGLTDSAVASINNAFRTHELIKIKVQESAPVTAKEAGEAIPDLVADSAHVQTIGRTVVLYRRHPDDPEIEID